MIEGFEDVFGALVRRQEELVENEKKELLQIKDVNSFLDEVRDWPEIELSVGTDHGRVEISLKSKAPANKITNKLLEFMELPLVKGDVELDSEEGVFVGRYHLQDVYLYDDDPHVRHADPGASNS